MSTGYIYKISKDDIIYYIGSTFNYNRRLSQHKHIILKNIDKRPIHNHIISNGGFDNYNFSVVEVLNNVDKNGLLECEKKWIKETNPIFNCQIPNRGKKEYYLNNIEHLKEKSREYGRIHDRSDYLKNWYEKNLCKIKEERSVKKECKECGKKISSCNLHRHMKNIHNQ